MENLKNTQHFTTNYKDILYNINFFPKEVIDPFAGNCDLENYSPKSKWTFYDIDVKNSKVIYNDSLLNPINYNNKSIITNPPYLAKNKTKDFDKVFKKYKTDDLYKASILSIIGCKNGILIIPLNFFTDERTSKIRKMFLSQYKVEYVNFFTYQVFENTTYNVCSFYFEKGVTNDVEFFDFKNKKSYSIILKEEFGFRVGGEFYNAISKINPKFSRVKDPRDSGITNIFVNCIDKKNEKLGLSYNTNTYYGKDTDRVFATLRYPAKNLSEKEQKDLIKKFNNFILNKRKNPLLFTNYRDNGRKRISFEDVYKICTGLIEGIL